MKITKHGEYLTQLTRLTFVNCFLVREDDGFTLVDTGMSGSAKRILQITQQLGAPVRRIVLTHAHVDHVGSLDALHALLPQAEVSISARDARFMKGDKSLDANEPQAQLRGGYPLCSTVPTHLLKDGDMVGSLEVVASPGHTPGHIALFDHRDKTLIAGDAYSNKLGLTTAGTLRLLFPFTAMATWHRLTALESAERLMELNPSQLAVGHGKVTEDPRREMERAISEASRSIKGYIHAATKAY